MTTKYTYQPETTAQDHITNAETALDAAIKAAVESGNIELAERIRNAAFHVANILGVQITEGDIEE